MHTASRFIFLRGTRAGKAAVLGVSASKPENCTLRLNTLTPLRTPNLFEEHVVERGPRK